MQIYITTLGRVGAQKTLHNLPEDVQRETILVVQDHEYTKHQQLYRDVVKEVRALPPEVRTLGPTRRMVFEWREDRKILLLDDDLDFYWRRIENDWHLTTPNAPAMWKMLTEIDSKLDVYSHVGVSGREGNNRVSAYGVECTRYMRLLGYRTDWPRGVAQHGRIDGMSDFDVNLQLLRAGYPSYVFFRWAQGQSGTQTPGGCSLDRTLEKHEAEVDFMVREHAPFVKKRLKQNKTGGTFGTRPEVTIYWQRAYESGRALRALQDESEKYGSCVF